MTERMIKSGDVDICTEAFGDESDTPILLIMGASASMLMWPEELCERLAAAGRFVIRYDNRDTGLSKHYPLGEPEYTVEDMADDAVGPQPAISVRPSSARVPERSFMPPPPFQNKRLPGSQTLFPPLAIPQRSSARGSTSGVRCASVGADRPGP